MRRKRRFQAISAAVIALAYFVAPFVKRPRFRHPGIWQTWRGKGVFPLGGAHGPSTYVAGKDVALGKQYDKRHEKTGGADSNELAWPPRARQLAESHNTDDGHRIASHDDRHEYDAD